MKIRFLMIILRPFLHYTPLFPPWTSQYSQFYNVFLLCFSLTSGNAFVRASSPKAPTWQGRVTGAPNPRDPNPPCRHAAQRTVGNNQRHRGELSYFITLFPPRLPPSTYLSSAGGGWVVAVLVLRSPAFASFLMIGVRILPYHLGSFSPRCEALNYPHAVWPVPLPQLLFHLWTPTKK